MWGNTDGKLKEEARGGSRDETDERMDIITNNDRALAHKTRGTATRLEKHDKRQDHDNVMLLNVMLLIAHNSWKSSNGRTLNKTKRKYSHLFVLIKLYFE